MKGKDVKAVKISRGEFEYYIQVRELHKDLLSRLDALVEIYDNYPNDIAHILKRLREISKEYNKIYEDLSK